MKVLLCGADGFLGRHIAAALVARGHQVVRGVRRARLPGDVLIDYRIDTAAEIWEARMPGIDVAINAVGILRESRSGDFDLIHHRAPVALFEACRRAGTRAIQISALGTTATAYLSSKRAADQALRSLLGEQGVVLRPGLVFGNDGDSTRFFLMMASLPVQGDLRGAGDVQPIHVDDVAALVVRVAEGARVAGGILEAPGPRRLGYREWMATYRDGLQLAPPVRIPLPAWAMAAAARLAGLVPGSLLTPDTWAMLRAGNIGDPGPAQALLGRRLTPPHRFVAADAAEWLRLRALAQWRRPLFIAVLGLIWLASALLSAGIFPVASSLALLAPFGLSGPAAMAVLALAIVADLSMAALTVWRPGRRLWQAQIALIVGYSLLVAWKLPMFLIHPFGPILKNLAVIVLLVELWAEERKP